MITKDISFHSPKSRNISLQYRCDEIGIHFLQPPFYSLFYFLILSSTDLRGPCRVELRELEVTMQ